MTIEQIQCLLKYLGYYTGKVDGLWGRLSAQAVVDFQDDYGLEPTGTFDDATSEMVKKAVAGLVEPVPKDPQAFWAEIKHFDREEFRCKCGGKYCDGFPEEPSEKLIRMADRVREHFEVPAIVSSGLRCEIHNRNEGGVENSRHRFGKAMDFRLKDLPASVALPYIQSLPDCRYAYAIDTNYIHMDVE